MKISFQLSSVALRVLAFGLALILCAGLAGAEIRRFVTNVVASPGLPIDLTMLESAAAYFPNSAKVRARLASRMVESQLDGKQSHEALAETAFRHAAKAVELAPANYEYRVLLSAAAELKGDGATAESALREAARLAPNNVSVRWQMANLLLRTGKVEESLGEFRYVAETDPRRLPNALDLLWRATGGDLSVLERVLGADPKARLTYAEFLTEQNLFEAAAQAFARCDRANRLQSPLTGRVLDAFLKSGQWEWADRLWRDTMATDNQADNALLWNGSFEHAPRKGLTQFDWHLNDNNFAKLAIQAGGKSGQRALRLAYLGVDTTRLESEAQHLLYLKPGATYRLECFAKPERLVTDEGPKIAVVRADTREVLADSVPVSTAANAWQLLAVDFVVPAESPAVMVTIRQIPRYRFTEPTQGVIWFDDFTLKTQ